MSQVLSARQSSAGAAAGAVGRAGIASKTDGVRVESCDLELGFNVTVPSGRLGRFTKVVQFWPRFLVVNKLDTALVLEQNVSLRTGSKRVACVPAGAKSPFHLPQVQCCCVCCAHVVRQSS
jgi:SHR-binding domain of vacuolar-sorting associated protein 13